MGKAKRRKRALIIQPAIPHYRIPFFNALERLRPDWWEFCVTFDDSESSQRRSLFETIDRNRINFPLQGVRRFGPIGRFEYQTAWIAGARSDLIIAEHAVRDIVYLTSMLHRLHGVKFAWWGHGRDRSLTKAKGLKAAAEWVKPHLARLADGYFAYTQSIRQEMITNGLQPDRVFALNNTIDIEEQRRAYENGFPRRVEIRRELGVESGIVLLFVGRFTANKRVPFLIEAFNHLRKRRADVHLFLIGGGGEKYELERIPGVRWFGGIEDIEKLAPIYTASDLFVFPGAVGLGPLQALCYDLPVVAIDSDFHGPEVEYLTAANSIMLPRQTSELDYANAVDSLLNDPDQLRILRSSTWQSIRHLTIDNMARNFIEGVNTLLEQGTK